MLKLEALQETIEALAAHAGTLRDQQARELDTACERLTRAPDAAILREQLRGATASAPHAAMPVTDAPLDTVFTVTDAPAPGATIIGVDGSQIPPDRHAAVLYYLLQIGGLIFRYNGTAPTEHRTASLHFAYRELYDSAGQLIGSQLGMRRNVRELEYLAELTELAHAADTPAPCIALTDGPLLWPYSGRSEEEATALPAYFTALNRLRAAGGLPVGFVERPGGRPLLALLELDNPPEQSAAAPPILTDHTLMARQLPPGARSVWLKRPTPMNERHAHAGHTIWFCYLNVGTAGDPVIARVEAPAWAVAHESWVTTLHALLLHQAHALGGNPYVLARAHELALVTGQDKAALESLLLRRLLEHGVVARPSEKARQKSLLGSF